MPDITALSFSPSPIVIAVDAIMERLASARDRNGTVVFPIVQRGLLIPEQQTQPPIEQLPMILVWHDNPVFANEGDQFYITERRVGVQLYLYLYSYGTDGQGLPLDLQAKREEIVEFIFDQLRPPAKDNPDGTTLGLNSAGRRIWRFAGQHDNQVDHTSAFKRFGQMVPPKPPWYVTRIDLELEVYDEDND